MADLVYNKGLEEVGKAATDLDGSDLRIMLVRETYVANKDHLFVDDGTPDDPLSHELGVAGYTRIALANKVIARDDVNDFAYLDADDPVWASLATGQTIGGAVLYRHVGADTVNPLIAFYDVTNTPTNGGQVTHQFATPANGGALKLVSL